MSDLCKPQVLMSEKDRKNSDFFAEFWITLIHEDNLSPNISHFTKISIIYNIYKSIKNDIVAEQIQTTEFQADSRNQPNEIHFFHFPTWLQEQGDTLSRSPLMRTYYPYYRRRKICRHFRGKQCITVMQEKLPTQLLSTPKSSF